MERQVQTLMQSMGDVLGPNCGQQLERRQLQRAGHDLLSKLGAGALFWSWVMDWGR